VPELRHGTHRLRGFASRALRTRPNIVPESGSRRSNRRIVPPLARWDNASMTTGPPVGHSRQPVADEKTGFFVATCPLVTLSPRRFSEDIEPSGQFSTEKHLGYARNHDETRPDANIPGPDGDRNRYQ